MDASIFLPPKRTDIGALRKDGDARALISYLAIKDEVLRQKAIDALVELGPRKADILEKTATRHRNLRVRLGAIEVLGAQGLPEYSGPLATILRTDRNDECRWAAALALGLIADTGAVKALVDALGDHSKYVRYGASVSLDALGWEPGSDEERISYLIAGEKWDDIVRLRDIPAGPLVRASRDADPNIRIAALGTIGKLERPDTGVACTSALQDRDGRVRWQASLALQHCGVSRLHLPLALSRWPRSRDPRVAALLNLLFLGLGYNYLGKWWGFLLFQLYATTTAILLIFVTGMQLFLPVLSVPYSIPFAVHAYYIGKKMEE